MKRALHFVLLTLMSLSTIEASAAAKKQSKHPKKKPAAVRVYKAEPGVAIAVSPRPKPQKNRMGIKSLSDGELVAAPGPGSAGPPTEGSMRRAGSPQLDLRLLPQTPPIREDRPEREGPVVNPVTIEGKVVVPPTSGTAAPALNVPAPSPSASFPGLDFANWGSGRPPDTVGDVGPNHYIQAVNASIGVYSKSGGAPLAAFTFNTLMSQGHFGNLCDTNNFGDPIILYDTFEDRWVITDFAFVLSGGNVVNPPGSYQCFAVSKTGDPISGGWNFYSLHITDLLNDYPKLGIWPDGIYMSANMFGFPATGTFQGTRAWVLNKAQMYAGAPSIQVVQFNPPASEFALLPSNARLQAGTPPPGSPNYFSTVWNFSNAVSTYKFHVDWNRISLSTFDGPFVTIAPSSWIAAPSTVPAKSGNNNDTLDTQLMMQNQYTNLGGVESLWLTHTVRNPSTAGVAAVRYYQTNVSAGSIAANTAQAATHAPDAINRYMPSLAVDRAGNMALGYSASTSTLFPAIRYAGRLSADPVNSLPQTETSLIEGTGSQNSSNRWGDYSAMSLDPDGCTFWFTNEYYATVGGNWQTRIGSFNYGPSACMLVATGNVSGTVTATVGGAPIVGAAISFGSRTATTNGSGAYSFPLIPSGTYSDIAVTAPGYNTGTATTIVVTDGNTTTKDFSLSSAPASGCLLDTAQADFQTGVPTNTDLTSTPGAVILLNTPNLDQQNTSLSSSGSGVDTVNWGGQTFTAGLTGPLARADVNVFCSACTGTFPNLTLSLRATSGNLPTGPDLATATLTGTNGAAAGYLTATFANPATVTAGTTYALIVRPVANPSTGSYALTFSSGSPYANGQSVSSTDGGGTWIGSLVDLGFRTYVKIAFTTSGDFVSALKDANPAPGATPIWSALSWAATVPANTSLKFQAAASNSSGGPFTFVGPDGTAATFFTTSGASLSQFYGFRYLRYKAFLATTDTTQTPALNDVTICYSVADCSAPIAITPTPSQVCANSTGNTASGPAGAASYAWSIVNGTIVGSAASQSVTYTAGASGSVGLTLAIVEAGGCHKSASGSVTIAATPTPAVTPGGPTTFCTGGSVTLTSSSAIGNQWYNGATLLAGQTNQTYLATTTGNYNVVVTTSGCPSAPSASTAVTVSAIPPAPTVTPGGPTTFCAGSSVNLTSSSATGNQWYDGATLLAGQTSQTFVATASGNYNVVATTSGCSSAPSSSTAVTVNPLPPTPAITPGGPTTFCAGGSVTLTSSSASGNQWFLNGNPIGGASSQAYAATASGNYTVKVTDGNACTSAASAITIVTVNAIPATPTITPSGTAQFCSAGSKTLTSSSAMGNQWYLEGTAITGATNQTVSADTAGHYTVIVTTNGCSSASSAATNVAINPTPAKPVIAAGGATTFCAGGGVTLSSNSASGNQWYLDGNPITGGTNQNFVASGAGSYTATVTSISCVSNASDPVLVTVNPLPATPAITPGGPTTFCAGGSVVLTSSGASGNQWFLNGNAIGGATNQTYSATSSGSYTVKVTGANSCTSTPSSATVVTVNPIPATPTITPGGPTTFCAGGSVNLTSSSASGNQWFLNGNPIGGATNQVYSAIASGSYAVTVTTAGCISAGTTTVVTVNPRPNATITAPISVITNATGDTASVASAGAGATYVWGITGGVITAGSGTNSITFTAGGPGTLTLNVTVTTSAGCGDTKSANVTVALPPVTVTTVAPGLGTTAGGSPITINGSGFVAGAAVNIGGTAATNVVVVSAIKITAKTPAHAAGTVNVGVTNTDTSTGTLTSGFRYQAIVFDPNADSVIDPADIFFLINYLFTGGQAPHGEAGLLSGDANNDGVIDPADIFFIINYLFLGGPSTPAAFPNAPRAMAAGTEGPKIAGSISLGTPVLRGGHYFVPVIMTARPGSIVPQTMSLEVHFDAEGVGEAVVRRAGVARDLNTVFEFSRRTGNDLSYLVSYDPRGLDLGVSRSAVVAEIEIEPVESAVSISIDPLLTMLGDQTGTTKATVANGKLGVSGTTIGTARPPRPRPPRPEVN